MFQTSEKSPLFNRSYYSLFRIQKEKKQLFGTNLKFTQKKNILKIYGRKNIKFGCLKIWHY